MAQAKKDCDNCGQPRDYKGRCIPYKEGNCNRYSEWMPKQADVEVMAFPATWEEWERQYGFNDKKEIYTNGIKLIPCFRVRQWLEHIQAESEEQHG